MQFRPYHWLVSRILFGSLFLSACIVPTSNAQQSSSYQQAANTNNSSNPNRSISRGFTQPASEGKRVALIIGNAAYRYTDKLGNTLHDAQDLAAALRQLGFTVIHKTDLNKQGMEQTLREFATQLRGAKVGLFFYAGHGMQHQGENFLVSVNANPSVGEEAILQELVTADKVLQIMEQTKIPTKVLILDACRNNPVFKKGLAAMQSQAEYNGGTFIAYSTQPNKVASDGNGRNSPYAGSLLMFINEPNVPIEMLFKKVATRVSEQTRGAQIPWVSTALLGGDLCLAGCFTSGAASSSDAEHCTTRVDKGLYQGECKNGLPEGQGVMKYESGEYYQGSFVNGLRHGQGIQYLTDGTEIEGNFCNGRLCR